MKVLILGVNGFIGSHLTERILNQTDWEVFGMDLGDDKISHLIGRDKFTFVEGDISINYEWIGYHVKKCDVCLPLVAIATPSKYVTDPLGVFKLDFEENLRIIRQCAQYKTRVIFPSTSEVYGMSKDEKFSEETSQMVYGPINKQRWIYACSKQLLDRVIWAMNIHEELEFSLIRPFNWIGPRLDNINVAKEGSSRVMTQFLGNMMRGEPINLVDGGSQRRSFTYIDDGIDALMTIIENKHNKCAGKIFNLGNPNNDLSIRELAYLMAKVLKTFPDFADRDFEKTFSEVESNDYYGKGYEDMLKRTPDITNAQTILNWHPKVSIEDALTRTMEYYINSEQLVKN